MEENENPVEETGTETESATAEPVVEDNRMRNAAGDAKPEFPNSGRASWSVDTVKRAFLLWGMVDGVRKRDDWTTIEMAVKFYDDGIFSAQDLERIRQAIIRRNQTKGLSSMDEDLDAISVAEGIVPGM